MHLLPFALVLLAAILKAIQELSGRIQSFDARLTVLEQPKQKVPHQVNGNTSAPESFPGDFIATKETFPPMTKEGVEAGIKLLKQSSTYTNQVER